MDLLQNVDGMHQRAGSENIIEFHGNLYKTICSKEKIQVDDMDVISPNDEGDNTIEPLKIPSCPQCGALIRPGVIWFGEVCAFFLFLELVTFDYSLSCCLLAFLSPLSRVLLLPF